MMRLLVPSPGIYAVITLPVLSLTLAIFLSPELGFLGFVVPTFKHTPFNSGLSLSCGDRNFRAFFCARPWRRTWINVHLCARDEGAGPRGCAKAVVGKVAMASDGRGSRDVKTVGVETTDGRMARRRNVRDMVGGCGGLLGVAMGKSSRWRMMDD